MTVVIQHNTCCVLTMKISVVIPVYKNKQMFLSHLRQNYEYLKDHEIIVVDDASGEGLKADIEKEFGDVRVFVNEKNMGFSSTVNRGVEAATGELIFLLNSDVELFDKSYMKALKHFADGEVFGVSFAQIEKDKAVVGKNRIYFEHGQFLHAAAKDLSPGLNAWVEGGTSMVRKSYFDLLGGFDKIYNPFYWEDIDLSYRAYKRGWRILFAPDIKVRHHHETTIASFYDRSDIVKISYRNQFIFTWINIHNPLLFLYHILYIPVHSARSLMRWKTAYIAGLVAALCKIGRIGSCRIKRRGPTVRTDKQVLKLFR